MNLPIVTYSLTYNSKDITRDITDQVLGITYTDKIGGESDTLEITVEDKDLRWQNSWYPQKGDTMQLIIRQLDRQLNCGIFEVDELDISFSISGDVFSIKGLASGIKKKMRTKNSYAHEEKSLREIAATVAAGLGLTIMGSVPDIQLGLCNQYRETDLSFLNRIGNDYGCVFSVRGANLIFTYYKDLEGRQPSLTLTKQQLISGNLKDTTHKTFKKCRVKHHDPVSKEVVEYVANYDDDDQDEEQSGQDDLEIRSRVENKRQAEAKSKHALFKSNTEGVGGDIAFPGNVLFVSGNNVQLNGLGNFSGVFHILQSVHSLTRDGAYAGSGNLKRVKRIDPSFFKTI
jgi:phage protein D